MTISHGRKFALSTSCALAALAQRRRWPPMNQLIAARSSSPAPARSRRSATQSLAPIDVLSAKDLQASGKQSVRDLLGTLVPSINVSNSGAGASFAVKTLRCAGWRAIRC
jgi:iron complex outermembrane receptor protein